MQPVNPNFEFFISELPNLIGEHRGQFVLIKDQSIKGYYPTLEQALTEAYAQFGDTDFLIQEITDEKRVNYVNFNFIKNY